MKIIQERTLSMYAAVADFLAANTTAVAGLQNFSALSAAFGSKIAALRLLQQQQRGTISGDMTQKKVDLRREVVLQTRQLINALKAHYDTANDDTHNIALKKTASSWDKLADTNVVSDVRNVLGLAQTVAADLVDYGIDATWLATYSTKITAYEIMIPKPRLTVVKRADLTKALETNFAEAKKLLDSITIQIGVLEFSNASFYSKFLGAKKIISSGSRVTAFRMSIKSTDGVAQTGFTVQLLRQATGETAIYKTNKNGTLVRQNMVDGVYEITITKVDYAPLSGKVAVVAGETYVLEVTVDVAGKVFKDGRNPKTGEAI
jgi:hypothetical protein